MPVPLGSKPELAAGFFLDFFKFGPAHFLNAPARNADDVVVMRPLQINLKAPASGLIGNMIDKPALFKHLERAENRGLPYAMRPHRLENFLLAEVALRSEKKIKDAAALAGQPQAALLEMTAKDGVDFPRVVLSGNFAGQIVEFFHDDIVPYSGAIMRRLALGYRVLRRQIWPRTGGRRVCDLFGGIAGRIKTGAIKIDLGHDGFNSGVIIAVNPPDSFRITAMQISLIAAIRGHSKMQAIAFL